MNPLFFGSSDEPLFGVYHPPQSDVGRSMGVVLCYPMGQEYMRAHRAFRQLALLLSRAGFHVLRFDYFGTGDSSGNGEDATIERWIADVGTAIDELKDTADIDEVAVVGLRLGATLASHATADRADVRQLVLWDPVVSGAAYLDEELRQHAGAGTIGAGTPTPHPAKNGGDGKSEERDGWSGTVGVMGFPLSPALRHSLGALDLAATPLHAGTETLVVVSSEPGKQEGKEPDLRSSNGKNGYICIPSEGNWNEVDDFGSALIPQAIIRTIVNHLSERAGA
jgi:pimeloyl-ACP methyl ester carboxylesterase